MPKVRAGLSENFSVLTDVEAISPLPASMLDLGCEVSRARLKFPSNAHMFAALSEEVGEVAKALLEGQGRDRIRAEALQVACVAMRLYEEGDADFPEKGSAK
jgi:hypothetical protein